MTPWEPNPNQQVFRANEERRLRLVGRKEAFFSLWNRHGLDEAQKRLRLSDTTVRRYISDNHQCKLYKGG